MLPELGHFCLILAFSLALLQMGIYCSKLAQINIMRPIALGQTFFVSLAFMLLICAFLQDDFSVQYVAQNSNSSLPWYFKFTALWGAHEGSLLLWILFLSIWTLLLTITARSWPLQFSNSVLTVFAVVNAGFLLIMLWYSNPFMRMFAEIPLDGNDLNPLLQDFGMIIHPPVLYAGYVGCTVPFALAIGALLEGKLDQTWARLIQPWVLGSWILLTLGIALGSWWAYYELGWGGWWFWDPVENASFMPWLTATALLHCLAVARKNGRLLSMALFLCIATFGLSLFGTFLVRSGAIISVHAFATDPQRGFVILQFLAITVGGALLLYTIRTPKLLLPIASKTVLPRADAVILANNIVLLVATGTVLLGTLYPLIYDAMFGSTISVGYPYFNAVFVPIMFILFAVMLFGLFATRRLLIMALLISLVVAVTFLYLWFGTIKIGACLGLFFALAIIASCFKSKNLAMILAHLGLAISIIGISLTPAYEIEKDLRLQIGDHVQIADYDINFFKVENIDGANFVGFKGDFIIRKGNKDLAIMQPEKRIYLAREMPMTETAILPGLLQDLYIALGQQLEPDTWSARIYYKPFVRWIWLGAIIMAAGAGYGIWQRKYKNT